MGPADNGSLQNSIITISWLFAIIAALWAPVSNNPTVLEIWIHFRALCNAMVRGSTPPQVVLNASFTLVLQGVVLSWHRLDATRCLERSFSFVKWIRIVRLSHKTSLNPQHAGLMQGCLLSKRLCLKLLKVSVVYLWVTSCVFISVFTLNLVSILVSFWEPIDWNKSPWLSVTRLDLRRWMSYACSTVFALLVLLDLHVQTVFRQKWSILGDVMWTWIQNGWCSTKYVFSLWCSSVLSHRSTRDTFHSTWNSASSWEHLKLVWAAAPAGLAEWIPATLWTAHQSPAGRMWANRFHSSSWRGELREIYLPLVYEWDFMVWRTNWWLDFDNVTFHSVAFGDVTKELNRKFCLCAQSTQPLSWRPTGDWPEMEDWQGRWKTRQILPPQTSGGLSPREISYDSCSAWGPSFKFSLQQNRIFSMSLHPEILVLTTWISRA